MGQKLLPFFHWIVWIKVKIRQCHFTFLLACLLAEHSLWGNGDDNTCFYSETRVEQWNDGHDNPCDNKEGEFWLSHVPLFWAVFVWRFRLLHYLESDEVLPFLFLCCHLQSAGKNKWKMSFVMPAKYGSNLPRPKDPSVIIKEVPSKKVAVAAFSGP